jgi:hypothetical protein
MASQGGADVVVAGIGIGVEQGLGGKNQPRRTKAALHGAFGQECLLDGVQLTVGWYSVPLLRGTC